MGKNWGSDGDKSDMSIFEPEAHFGDLAPKRSKVDRRTRKLDDRGMDVVKDTGHHGVSSMPKRPVKKQKTVKKHPGFESDTKNTYW